MIMSARRKLSRSLRNNEFAWRYVYNYAPTLVYRRSKKVLTGESARVLGELNDKGIAIASAKALFGNESLFL